MKYRIFATLLLAGLLVSNLAKAQFTKDPLGRNNAITTAVPFLMIAPDTRSGAMGDAGVATTPDANSQHWNPAKYAFVKDDMGVSISYTPWLRKIAKDMNLGYVAGYYRLNKENVLSASLLYFDMGKIPFRDNSNQPLRDHQPHEFAIDLGYSRLLGDHFSGAVALRYVHSNLTGGISVGQIPTSPGKSVAGDVAFFYTNDNFGISGMDGTFNAGVNISNIGSKMSYSDNSKRDFIPTNFRLGVYYELQLDEFNSLGVTAEMNKLLVPTPPQYYAYGDVTPAGDTITESNTVIELGKDPNISVPAAMFSSWSDAPGVVGGSVFAEEMAEITWSIGAEYWYDKKFALRAGYFSEHQYKGARKFASIGAGLKLNVFGLDFAYLIPTKGFNTSPLANTLRFTLTFDLGAQGGKEN